MVERWTWAWLSAAAIFALHVADEAYHGSFGFYGDMVALLSLLAPSIQLPEFKYDVWLIDLVGAIVVLLALTLFVHRKNPVMIVGSYVFAAFLTLNATWHLFLAASIMGLVPGILTAPFVLLAGLFLFTSIPGYGQRKPASA